MCVRGRTQLGGRSQQRFSSGRTPDGATGNCCGMALALMETLADYGTVQYFGVPTFTTGIFRTWFGLGTRQAASQLSAILLGFVIL